MIQITPNILTLLRIFCALGFPFIYWWHPLSALILFSLGFYTDYLDGKVARKYNLTSNFGARLDRGADKLFYLIPLWTIWLDLGSSLLFGIAIMSTVFEAASAMSMIPALERKLNAVIHAKWPGKWKFVLQGAAIAAFLLHKITLSSGILFSFEAGIIFASAALVLSMVSLKSHLSSNKKAV